MSWQPPTFTKQGLAALAHMSGSITQIKAFAGSGTVENLMEQTELLEPKQELVVIEDGILDNRRWFRLQATGHTESYILNQLGLFISIDDGPLFLYIATQNKDGDNIPSSKAVPNFIAEYTLPVTFSNEMTYDAPPSGIGTITPDALDARLLAFSSVVDGRFDGLEEKLAGLGSGVVFSAARPEGDWKLWLQDLGEVPDYPTDDEPGEIITPILFDTAPLDAPGDFAVIYGDGSGETILNMTDDPDSAGDNDIIIVEQ